MTENEPTDPLDLYAITQLQRVIDASGWTVIYIGLLTRYLCHPGRGIIDHIQWDEPKQVLDELFMFIEKIQADPWSD